MDALARVKAFLPSWMGWLAPSIYFQAFGVLSVLTLVWLCRSALGPVERACALASANGLELHWTERVRMGFAARYEYGLLAVLIVLSAGLAGFSWNGPFSVMHAVPIGILLMLLLTLVALHLSRTRVRPGAGCIRLTLGQQLVGTLGKGWVLSWAGWLLVAALVPPLELVSGRTLVWLAVMVVVVGAAQFGATVLFGRLVGLVKPAPHGLAQRVLEFAQGNAIPLRHVCLIRIQHPNAYLVPGPRTLLLTAGLLSELPEEEVMGIAVRELGILAEARPRRLVRFGIALMFLPLGLVFPISHSLGFPVALLTLVLAYVGLKMYSRLVTKQAASVDAFAAKHGWGAQCAAGLERLARLNGIPAMVSPTNPQANLYDRLVALGRQPDYPRPEPIAFRTGRVLVGCLGVFIAFVCFGIVLPRIPGWVLPELRQRVAWNLSTKLGDGDLELMNAGRSFAFEGDRDLGDLFYDAALQVSPEPSFVKAHRAETWAENGRCSDAEVSVDAAFVDLPEDRDLEKAWNRADKAVDRCWRRLRILDHFPKR